MPERLIGKPQLAEKFSMSPNAAAALLQEKGVYPINFGLGRGRGLRWLESAVDAVLVEMNAAAVPKGVQKKQPHPRPQKKSCGLSRMSAAQVQALLLTNATCIQ